MNRNLFGIFMKYPEPGRVKTRLARDIGNAKAAEVYRKLAELILKKTDPVSFSHHAIQYPTLKKRGRGDLNENSQMRKISPTPSRIGSSLRVDPTLPTVGRTEPPKRGIHGNCSRNKATPAAYERVIIYDPPERLHDFEQWIPGSHFILQQGKDIGDKMDNAIRQLLAQGAEKAVITGADIPDLNSEIIMQAFAALDNTDIVIGPARDGGYYLIGMKEPHSEIFQGIPWSTGTVLDKAVHAIRELKLSHAHIATLSDLDTPDDYKEFLTQPARPKPERSS